MALQGISEPKVIESRVDVLRLKASAAATERAAQP